MESLHLHTSTRTLSPRSTDTSTDEHLLVYGVSSDAAGDWEEYTFLYYPRRRRKKTLCTLSRQRYCSTVE